MRTFIKMAMVLVMAFVPAVLPAEPALRLKVMTYNIRTMGIPDGMNNWYLRRSQVAALIARQAPDLFGLQEAFTPQAAYIAKKLGAYEWFGPARDDGRNAGERCPIFYRRDRFDLLDHGAFWLSETPDKPARGWDAAFPRLVTWGRFRDKATGRELFYFNTHFDHMGKQARTESAKLILAKIRAIAGTLPAIANGDFNLTDDTEGYKIIAGELKDARLLAAAPQGPEGTTRDFATDSQAEHRIDYFFLSDGITVESYRVLDDTYGNKRRPSDHMPVVVELSL